MTSESPLIRFALPDGHIMNHVEPYLEKIGVEFQGYEKAHMNLRPRFRPLTEKAASIFESPEKLWTKIIRPQDMPMHVSNGNFDVALSGTDWLREHKIRFPNSPTDADPLLKLDFSKVRIVAAAHKDYGSNLDEYVNSFRSERGGASFRIASEYVYIADQYGQKRNLHPYRVIMTYGATESLIPEDTDLIIENTETGNTLRRNNLEILETLMESQACLIVNRESMENENKRELLLALKTLFEQGII